MADLTTYFDSLALSVILNIAPRAPGVATSPSTRMNDWYMLAAGNPSLSPFMACIAGQFGWTKSSTPNSVRRWVAPMMPPNVTTITTIITPMGNLRMAPAPRAIPVVNTRVLRKVLTRASFLRRSISIRAAG
jgi:hypothetical protein